MTAIRAATRVVGWHNEAGSDDNQAPAAGLRRPVVVVRRQGSRQATTSCPAAARCGVRTEPRKPEAPVMPSFTAKVEGTST
jgi:hypothetical protein